MYLIEAYFLCMNGAARLRVVRLPGVPIFDHLILEEALYRSEPRCRKDGVSSGNAWLLQNVIKTQKHHFPTPAGNSRLPKVSSHPISIVLGLSGDPKVLVNLHETDKDDIPLIRRYTGGGTVIMSGTILITSLILPKTFTGVAAFPVDTMRWTGSVYSKVFPNSFRLVDNDYTVLSPNGEFRKFGGNAQAFSSSSIVHHTSFLWNADGASMDKYLSHPSRAPIYRKQRSHSDFITDITSSFHGVFESPECLMDKIEDVMTAEALDRGYQVEQVNFTDPDQHENFRRILRTFVETKDELRSTRLVDNAGSPMQDRDFVANF